MGNVSIDIKTDGDIDVFIETLGEFANLDRVLLKIGEDAMKETLNIIRNRVVDKQENAEGGTFTPYSESWKKQRIKEDVKPVIEPKNYNFTGTMWASRGIKDRQRSPVVVISGGVRGTHNEEKMWAGTFREEKDNSTKIMEINDDEKDRIIDIVSWKIDEAIMRRIKKNNK